MTKAISHKFKVGQTIMAADPSGEARKAVIVSIHDVNNNPAYLVDDGAGNEIVADEKHIKKATGKIKAPVGAGKQTDEQADLEGLDGLLSQLAENDNDDMQDDDQSLEA